MKSKRSSIRNYSDCSLHAFNTVQQFIGLFAQKTVWYESIGTELNFLIGLRQKASKLIWKSLTPYNSYKHLCHLN